MTARAINRAVREAEGRGLYLYVRIPGAAYPLRIRRAASKRGVLHIVTVSGHWIPVRAEDVIYEQ